MFLHLIDFPCSPPWNLVPRSSLCLCAGGNGICSFSVSLVDRHGKSMSLVCLKNYKSHHPNVDIYLINKPLKKGQTWCLRVLYVIWTLKLFLKRQESHTTLQQRFRKENIYSILRQLKFRERMWFAQDDLYLPTIAYSPPFLGSFAQSSKLCMVSFLFSWFLEAVLLFHYPGK